MLSDLEIQNLIGLPKMIGAKSPNKGYKEENGHERCGLAWKPLRPAEQSSQLS